MIAQNEWALKAMQFVKRHLPNALQEHGPGNEATAMRSVASAFESELQQSQKPTTLTEIMAAEEDDGSRGQEAATGSNKPTSRKGRRSQD